MPLCTTVMVWSLLKCGWEFTSLGTPWVAHRVWPIPIVPGMVSPPWVSSSSTFSRPTALVTLTDVPSNTAIPAESYPLYSSLESPSKITGAACLSPIYPTIPHIFYPAFPALLPIVAIHATASDKPLGQSCIVFPQSVSQEFPSTAPEHGKDQPGISRFFQMTGQFLYQPYPFCFRLYPTKYIRIVRLRNTHIEVSVKILYPGIIV